MVTANGTQTPLRKNGTLQVPGDKSISHRALMLGAIAEGTTHISNFLNGQDPIATLNALSQLGVHFIEHKCHEISVEGVGLQGLTQADSALNLGNSGTSMRLLSGLLAGQQFDSLLIGDASLMMRPMGRIVNPLKSIVAKIEM